MQPGTMFKNGCKSHENTGNFHKYIKFNVCTNTSCNNSEKHKTWITCTKKDNAYSLNKLTSEKIRVLHVIILT